jgi:uncharacterized protein (TIGR00645 family)
MKPSQVVERVIFNARWLLAPMYVGLVCVLAVPAYKFIVELITMFLNVIAHNDAHFILDLLELLDLVLLGNLIVIVLFAGYENFVSRIDAATNSVDRPKWMGGVDFSGLKIKLIGSLVAISVIQLLANFSELSTEPDAAVGPGMMWRIIIHLTFVVSGVLFAVMDWISDIRAVSAHRLHAGSEVVYSDSVL